MKPLRLRFILPLPCQRECLFPRHPSRGHPHRHPPVQAPRPPSLKSSWEHCERNSVSSPVISHELPPRLELECLKVLWSLGEASVRGVQAEVSKTRPLAY